MGVNSIAVNELNVRSNFGNVAVFEHNNSISVVDGGDAMRDDEVVRPFISVDKASWMEHLIQCREPRRLRMRGSRIKARAIARRFFVHLKVLRRVHLYESQCSRATLE